MNNTKKLTFIALLSSLAIVFTFLTIQYPFVRWLKFDLGELVVLFATTLLGLPAAIFVSFIKTFVQLFIGDQSPYYIGEITALIAALSFAIPFRLTAKMRTIYRLVIVSLVFTFVMVLLNFFVSTPIYLTQSLDYNNVIDMNVGIEIFDFKFVVDDTASYLKWILLTYVPFNLLKAGVISAIYMLTEKPIKKAFSVIAQTKSTF